MPRASSNGVDNPWPHVQLSVRLERERPERGGRRAGLGEGQRPVGVQLARGAHSVDAVPTPAAARIPPRTRSESGGCQHACMQVCAEQEGCDVSLNMFAPAEPGESVQAAVLL